MKKNTKYIQARLKKVQEKLKSNRLEALLVSEPANITYLTGVFGLSHLEREVFLIVTLESLNILVSPLRYAQFEHLRDTNLKAYSQENTLSNFLISSINTQKSPIGFNSHNLTVAELNSLKNKSTHVLTARPGIIEELRQVKDNFEVDSITKACQITAKSWEKIQPQITAGITEKQLSSLITATQIELGADGIPAGFDPIVAFGEHSAIPHHTSSHKKLTDKDVILVDYGCTVNGYCSDMTRTLLPKKPTSKQQRIHSVVNQAYQAAVASVQAEISTSHIDKIARNLITEAGFGSNFIHTTGHSLGLSVHELPSISPKATSQITNSMVITIEPGVYLPGEFGFRHENTLLVTATSPIELTTTS